MFRWGASVDAVGGRAVEEFVLFIPGDRISKVDTFEKGGYMCDGCQDVVFGLGKLGARTYKMPEFALDATGMLGEIVCRQDQGRSPRRGRVPNSAIGTMVVSFVDECTVSVLDSAKC